jgi:sec-independent protein translocase protein TatB
VQFLGVGWQEVLLIGILAFFVLGPERLPVVAYQIGRAVRTLQQYARAVRDEFGEELTYVEDQYKTIRGDFDEARQELRAQQREIDAEWRAQQREIDAGMKEAKDAVEGAGRVVRMSDRTTVDGQPAPAAAVNGSANGTAAAVPAIEVPAAEPTPAPRDGAPLVF